jgi:hypothetical protein
MRGLNLSVLGLAAVPLGLAVGWSSPGWATPDAGAVDGGGA